MTCHHLATAYPASPSRGDGVPAGSATDSLRQPPRLPAYPHTGVDGRSARQVGPAQQCQLSSHHPCLPPNRGKGQVSWVWGTAATLFTVYCFNRQSTLLQLGSSPPRLLQLWSRRRVDKDSRHSSRLSGTLRSLRCKWTESPLNFQPSSRSSGDNHLVLPPAHTLYTKCGSQASPAPL
jgi:hypothetical protein